MPDAVEVPRLDGRAVLGREEQVRFPPADTGGLLVAFPIGETEPKGGADDIRVRARCLGLAVQQLPTDPLELVLDADGHGVEVDGVRREAQELAFAESFDEDQDVGGVVGVVVVTGGGEERRASSLVQRLRFFLRTVGSFASLTTLRRISSSSIAQFSARRKQSRTSFNVRTEIRRWQQLPIAQQR
jgi:hypothetical protein